MSKEGEKGVSTAVVKLPEEYAPFLGEYAYMSQGNPDGRETEALYPGEAFFFFFNTAPIATLGLAQEFFAQIAEQVEADKNN